MRRLNMAEIVQVSVGEQGKTFVMHRDIAIRHSSFFKAAMSHDWKEAQEKHISLPDCEPEIFEGYLQWIYMHKVAYYTELPEQPLELVKLWILGDFLGDQHFCDAVVRALFSHQIVAGPDAIKHLYDHTSHDSHLRWHVLNIWATRYSFAHIADVFATDRTYPKSFIIDLVKFFAEHDRVMDRFGWVPQPYPARAANTVAASGAAITGDEEDEE